MNGNTLDWAGWKLFGHGLSFDSYVINVVALTSSDEVLDAIMRVSHKEWASDACVAGLVRALDDILNPQLHRPTIDHAHTSNRVGWLRQRHPEIASVISEDEAPRRVRLNNGAGREANR